MLTGVFLITKRKTAFFFKNVNVFFLFKLLYIQFNEKYPFWNFYIKYVNNSYMFSLYKAKKRKKKFTNYMFSVYIWKYIKPYIFLRFFRSKNIYFRTWFLHFRFVKLKSVDYIYYIWCNMKSNNTYIYYVYIFYTHPAGIV